MSIGAIGSNWKPIPLPHIVSAFVRAEATPGEVALHVYAAYCRLCDQVGAAVGQKVS